MAKQTIPLLDLMFFLTETQQSPKHVGAIQIFQLPARAPENYLRDLVAAFKKASKPGNTQQLMDVVQRLHAILLARKRPGWICQVIEGLEDNRFAVYSKVQHAG